MRCPVRARRIPGASVYTVPHLGHVEVDGMWTFVATKEARLTLEERALRHDIGDEFLWYGASTRKARGFQASLSGGALPTMPDGS